MVTQAKQWKSKVQVGEHELELPSGNTALLRAIRPEAFLEGGMIPDPLSSMIQQAINSKKGLPPAKMKELAADPKKLVAALEMFDRVLTYCVIEPEVDMPPTCIHEGDDGPCGHSLNGGDGIHTTRSHPKHHKMVEPARDPNVLYADQVDMEDKQFIFQWSIGGVSDVNKFREELRANVGAVQPGQSVGHKAE